MLLTCTLLCGLLAGLATYLLLQGGFVRLLFGALLLGNAINLAVLTLGGDPTGRAAPLVRGDGAAMVDPLPHALILTAIVIGFAVAAFLLFLLYRLFLDQRTGDARELYADLEREPAPHDDE